MSVKKIGKDKYRVTVLKGVDAETGKNKYFNRISNGTLQDARDLEAALEVQGGIEPKERVTLRCLLEDLWLPSLEVEANTYAYYESAVRVHIVPALGSMLVPNVTEFVIERFFRELPEGSVRTQCKKTLSPAFRAARKWHLMAYNPLELADVKIGKGSKRGGCKGYDTYSAEEVRAILEAVRGEDIEGGVLAMLCASARREEACALDKEDFDPLTGYAPVEKAFVVDSRTGKAIMKGPKNDASWRDLKFKGYSLDRMRSICCGGSGPIMAYKGARMRPDLFFDRWARLVKANGIRYLPVGHLRHTFATQSLLAGADVATLRDLMGHAHVSTIIDRYLKPLEAEQDAANERLALKFDPGRNDGPGSPAPRITAIRGGKAPAPFAKTGQGV